MSLQNVLYWFPYRDIGLYPKRTVVARLCHSSSCPVHYLTHLLPQKRPTAATITQLYHERTAELCCREKSYEAPVSHESRVLTGTDINSKPHQRLPRSSRCHPASIFCLTSAPSTSTRISVLILSNSRARILKSAQYGSRLLEFWRGETTLSYIFCPISTWILRPTATGEELVTASY